MENTVNGRKLRLKVSTPMHAVYDKPVEMVIARTSEGDIGVLYGHDNRSALLGDGVLRIYEENRKNEELLMVLGGVMTIENNEVTILSEIAEHPDKIQEFLAEQSAERTASVLADQDADLYTKRMENAIRNALVHFDVNTYPKLESMQDDGK